MAISQLEPIPYGSALLEGKPDTIAGDWYLWLFNLTLLLGAAPALLDTVALTLQAAAIASTPIPIAQIQGGYYRVSVYARVTRPATTSSSFQVTIGWTENGQVVSKALTAVAGNLVTSTDIEDLMIKTDQASPITYSATYASVGATSMQFSLDIVAERVGSTPSGGA